MHKLRRWSGLRPSAAAGRSPLASAGSLHIYFGCLSHSLVASALRLAEQAASEACNAQTALLILFAAFGRSRALACGER